MKEKSSTADIFGIPFPKRGKDDTYNIISDMLSKRDNIKIFTPNAEILWKSKKDPSLKALLLSADMLLPDGIGTVLAAGLSGNAIPCRITGIDTAEYILSVAERKGLSVYLLGGKDGVADRAACALKKRFPKLEISGVHHGYFSSEDEKNGVLAHITRTHPDILFVCLGFPAQERFIVENTPKLPFLRLSMGLGGSLDVWSGDLRRAPKIMRAAGLEWIFRLVSDPRRLKRLPYLVHFTTAVVRDRLIKQPPYYQP